MGTFATVCGLDGSMILASEYKVFRLAYGGHDKSSA